MCFPCLFHPCICLILFDETQTRQRTSNMQSLVGMVHHLLFVCVSVCNLSATTCDNIAVANKPFHFIFSNCMCEKGQDSWVFSFFNCEPCRPPCIISRGPKTQANLFSNYFWVKHNANVIVTAKSHLSERLLVLGTFVPSSNVFISKVLLFLLQGGQDPGSLRWCPGKIIRPFSKIIFDSRTSAPITVARTIVQFIKQRIGDVHNTCETDRFLPHAVLCADLACTVMVCWLFFSAKGCTNKQIWEKSGPKIVQGEACHFLKITVCLLHVSER